MRSGMMILVMLICGATASGAGCSGGNGNGTGPTVQEFGSMQGSVTSETGQQAIEGALVTIQGTAFTGTTDAQGEYQIGNVPVGAYTVESAATGYLSQTRSVTVSANQVATVDFALSPIEATANGVYYVSLAGNDANPGTSQQPWRTIQHAVAAVSAGDTVYIRAGAYGEEVQFATSGSAAEPITIAGVPSEQVSTTFFDLSRGVAYVSISNVRIEGFTNWGVTLNGDNHHIKLSELTIVGGEAGVRITYGSSGGLPEEGPVSDVVLENSVIRDCLYSAVDCTPGPCDRMEFRNLEITGAGLVGGASFGADGIAVERGRDLLVEDSYIHDNGGDGIDLNSRDTAGNVPGIIVRRNRVVRNYRNGIKLWAGGRMENNSVWGQGLSAIWLGVFPGALEVINNSIAYNMFDPLYSGRDYSVVIGYPEFPEGNPVPAAIDLTLVNNIIAHNSDVGDGRVGIYLGEGVSLVRESNNLFFSSDENEILALFVSPDREVTRAEIMDGTWAAETGQGSGDLGVAPLFVSGWPDVDLHLQVNSPAVDAGASNGAPADDLDGTPRPLSATYDIGAYER